MESDHEYFSYLDLMGADVANPSARIEEGGTSTPIEEGAPSYPIGASAATNPVLVEAHQGKRKVGARKTVQGVTREKKSNFSSQEDVLLVNSWLEISCDPMTNTGQKKDKFWDRITTQYNSNRGHAPECTLRSLQSRWDIIKAEVSKFSGYMAEALRKNPSGMTDSDKTSLAASMFAAGEPNGFGFMHCWEIMKNAPKWQDVRHNRATRDATGEEFRDQWPQASNNVDLSRDQSSPTQPSVGKRPLGRDAAKGARKKACSTSSSSIASEFAANMQVLNMRLDEDQNKWHQQHEEYIMQKKLEREELMRIEREKVEIEKKKAAAKEMMAAAEQRRAAAAERKADVLIMNEEERILSIDLDKCNPEMHIFYAAKKKQILARIAAESGEM